MSRRERSFLPSAVKEDGSEDVRAYGMWQFTSTATVLENGVTVESVGIASPSVDKNYCYKDYPTLIESLGYNGFEKPADNDTESI